MQVEAAAASDFIEREGESDVAEPVGALEPGHERVRPEVVRRAGVRPLFGAGRDQPHVAGGRRLRRQAPRQRDERPDARRIVMRPGRGRNAVRVRHRDHEAVGRRVLDPDDVPRHSLPGHREPLVPHAQPNRPEPRRHPLVRPPLSRRGRRPLSLPRERHREPVRLVPRRRHARRRRNTESAQTRHNRVTTACCSVPPPAPPSGDVTRKWTFFPWGARKSTLAFARLAARQWNSSTPMTPPVRACPPRRSECGSALDCCTPFIAGFTPGARQALARGLFSGCRQGLRQDAVLSHYSAAALWGLLKWDYRDPEVTAPNRGSTRASAPTGARSSSARSTWASRSLPAADVDRPFIDAAVQTAAQGGQRSPESAARQATPARDGESPRRKETPCVVASGAPTRNEFEDLVHALLEDLPQPHTNEPLLGYIPDFCWPAHRLILEADGRETHDQLLARADDKARQRVLEAHGYPQSSALPGARQRRSRPSSKHASGVP